MLINKKAVREYALAQVTQLRHHSFERVGASFIDRIEGAVRNTIVQEIKAHPSKGKTLQ
jgi:hypothetical protein